MLFAIAGFVEAEELVLGEVDYPPGKLPYRLLLPDGIESGEKFPLVICLHGGGGKGTDNQGAGCEAMTVPNTIAPTQSNNFSVRKFFIFGSLHSTMWNVMSLRNLPRRQKSEIPALLCLCIGFLRNDFQPFNFHGLFLFGKEESNVDHWFLCG